MIIIRTLVVKTALIATAVSLAGNLCRAADQSPETIAHLIYNSRSGDAHKYLAPALADVEKSVSPSWLYGGYYPDSPDVRFKTVEKTANEARISVIVNIDGTHLLRTLHLVRGRGTWIIDKVRLDEPEKRELP